MSLTPSNVRLDLKCGKGAISRGETCTKGPATKAEAPPTKRKSTPRAIKTEKFLKRAGMIGTLSGAAVSLGGLATGNTRLALHGLAGGMAASGIYNAGEAMGFERKGQKSKARAARAGAALRLTYGAGLAISTETALADIRRMQAQTRTQRNTYSGTGGRGAYTGAGGRGAYGGAGTGSRSAPRRGYQGDPFAEIGVSRNASKAELKRAWLAQMRKHHPDVGGDPEKAKKINEAYQEILRSRGDSVYADGFDIDWSTITL